MFRKRTALLIVTLLLVQVVLAACAQPTPEVRIVKETVVVEKEVIKEVQVGQPVKLVARCKASPPTRMAAATTWCPR